MPTASPPASTSLADIPVFWEEHKTTIIAGAAAVVLGITGYFGYRAYVIYRENAAAQALATATLVSDYQHVANRYAGTAAAANAYLLLAQRYREEKKFTESNTALQEFSRHFPKHQLITTAHMAIAANLEAMGREEEALTKYQQIVANFPSSFNAPFAFLSQVYLLKRLNRMEEGRRVCEQIMTQFRDSAVAGEASRQLRAMGGKMPEPGQPPQRVPAPNAKAVPVPTSGSAPTQASPTTAPGATP